jgi:hypothetical protein
MRLARTVAAETIRYEEAPIPAPSRDAASCACAA